MKHTALSFDTRADAKGADIVHIAACTRRTNCTTVRKLVKTVTRLYLCLLGRHLAPALFTECHGVNKTSEESLSREEEALSCGRPFAPQFGGMQAGAQFRLIGTRSFAFCQQQREAKAILSATIGGSECGMQ